MNPRIHCAPQNFYMGALMDIVCASPIASQCGSVRSLRRSFASVLTEFSLLNSVIRLLRGETAVISKESSAVYWMRLRDIVSYIMVANRTILGMERNLQVLLPVIRHIDAPFAVSANPTIDHSKTPRNRRNEQPLPPIMKNERPQPNNPTEMRAIQSRTQIAAQYSELAISDSTGYKLSVLV